MVNLLLGVRADPWMLLVFTTGSGRRLKPCECFGHRSLGVLAIQVRFGV